MKKNLSSAVYFQGIDIAGDQNDPYFHYSLLRWEKGQLSLEQHQAFLDWDTLFKKIDPSRIIFLNIRDSSVILKSRWNGSQKEPHQKPFHT